MAVPRGYKFLNRKKPPAFTKEHIANLKKSSVMKKPEHVRKLVKTRKKNFPFGYMADNVKYSGLHAWLRKNYGKPEYCEHCGLLGIIRDNGRWNIDYALKKEIKKHTKNIFDYITLCRPCHMKYDQVTIGRKRHKGAFK